ncbi:MAG: sigma-70 family RNA polymerase sigma factor [Acidobacteriota bacterium]|jgi:RNA polymerase sigma-70 factor (ECF subfamily)|nr:sigma-70 family RNA polymerase sigma factor [Acidobacteriota bacterium]
MYPDELTLPKDDSAVVQGAILDQANTGIALTFDELFERFSSMVFGLVYQILGDREEAMDVSQEVFLTVYRKLDTFRGESSLKTWIYCIAVHKAANRFRWWNRLRRRGTVSLEEHLAKSPNQELSWNLRSRDHSPEDILLLQEERSEIERRLLEIPLQQRIAVIMRDIEGLSYEEIAESLKVSLGTVKSRIARGREELKRRFQGAMC